MAVTVLRYSLAIAVGIALGVLLHVYPAAVVHAPMNMPGGPWV